jgi:hypothetical protein
MNHKTYANVTAALFLAISIMHLLRIMFGWEAQIGGLTIPLWVSWLALPITGTIAYFGFTQKR